MVAARGPASIPPGRVGDLRPLRRRWRIWEGPDFKAGIRDTTSPPSSAHGRRRLGYTPDCPIPTTSELLRFAGAAGRGPGPPVVQRLLTPIDGVGLRRGPVRTAAAAFGSSSTPTGGAARRTTAHTRPHGSPERLRPACRISSAAAGRARRLFGFAVGSPGAAPRPPVDQLFRTEVASGSSTSSQDRGAAGGRDPPARRAGQVRHRTGARTPPALRAASRPAARPLVEPAVDTAFIRRAPRRSPRGARADPLSGSGDRNRILDSWWYAPVPAASRRRLLRIAGKGARHLQRADDV